MGHTPESAGAMVATLRHQREEAGRLDERFEVVVGGSCTSEDDVAAWEAAGVDWLIVTPWSRTAEVFDTMGSFAQRFLALGRWRPDVGPLRLSLMAYEVQMIAWGSV